MTFMVLRQDMKNWWSHWLSFVFVEGNVQSRGEYSSKGIRLMFKNNSFLFIYFFPSDVLLLSAKQWSSVAFLLFAFFSPLLFTLSGFALLNLWPKHFHLGFLSLSEQCIEGHGLCFPVKKRGGTWEQKSVHKYNTVLLMAMWMWFTDQMVFCYF